MASSRFSTMSPVKRTEREVELAQARRKVCEELAQELELRPGTALSRIHLRDAAALCRRKAEREDA